MVAFQLKTELNEILTELDLLKARIATVINKIDLEERNIPPLISEIQTESEPPSRSESDDFIHLDTVLYPPINSIERTKVCTFIRSSAGLRESMELAEPVESIESFPCSSQEERESLNKLSSSSDESEEDLCQIPREICRRGSSRHLDLTVDYETDLLLAPTIPLQSKEDSIRLSDTIVLQDKINSLDP
jgi:hypothetical protein